jgi:hypothetical protein
MAKKKKKQTSTPRKALLDADMMTGEIPWSAEELGAVLQHAIALHHTPHDDWDRREKGINLLNDDGSVDRIRFNPDMFENQMMDFIIARLRKQGLSQDVMMSHGWRYMEATGFIAEHVKRLRQEELVIDDPDDPEASMISGGLIAALATARYEGVKLQGPKRIIAEAKRLDAEEE